MILNLHFESMCMTNSKQKLPTTRMRDTNTNTFRFYFYLKFVSAYAEWQSVLWCVKRVARILCADEKKIVI